MLTKKTSTRGQTYWVASGPDAIWDAQNHLAPDLIRMASLLVPSVPLRYAMMWPTFQQMSYSHRIDGFLSYAVRLVLMTPNATLDKRTYSLEFERVERNPSQGFEAQRLREWRFLDEIGLRNLIDPVQDYWEELTNPC
jgi:hypothetical protein